MKIVKNKDFEKDESLKRSDNPDSPLRYPMNVNWTETHEERISWLQYENYIMCEEYISAKLLYTLAKLRFQERGNEQLIGLERYKAAKEAFKLWEEVNQTRDEYFNTYLEKTREAYGKYHVAGRDDELENEEI